MWLCHCRCSASDTSLALHGCGAAVPKSGRTLALACSTAPEATQLWQDHLGALPARHQVVPTLVFAATGFHLSNSFRDAGQAWWPVQRAVPFDEAVRARAGCDGQGELRKKALTFTKSDHMHKHCLGSTVRVVLPHDIASSGDTARTLQKVMNESDRVIRHDQRRALRLFTVQVSAQARESEAAAARRLQVSHGGRAG